MSFDKMIPTDRSTCLNNTTFLINITLCVYICKKVNTILKIMDGMCIQDMGGVWRTVSSVFINLYFLTFFSRECKFLKYIFEILSIFILYIHIQQVFTNVKHYWCPHYIKTEKYCCLCNKYSTKVNINIDKDMLGLVLCERSLRRYSEINLRTVFKIFSICHLSTIDRHLPCFIQRHANKLLKSSLFWWTIAALFIQPLHCQEDLDGI